MAEVLEVVDFIPHQFSWAVDLAEVLLLQVDPLGEDLAAEGASTVVDQEEVGN